MTDELETLVADERRSEHIGRQILKEVQELVVESPYCTEAICSGRHIGWQVELPPQSSDKAGHRLFLYTYGYAPSPADIDRRIAADHYVSEVLGYRGTLDPAAEVPTDMPDSPIVADFSLPHHATYMAQPVERIFCIHANGVISRCEALADDVARRPEDLPDDLDFVDNIGLSEREAVLRELQALRPLIVPDQVG